MRSGILLLLAFAIFPATLFAGPTLGRVVMQEGEIKISRDGEYLVGDNMKVGPKRYKALNQQIKGYTDTVHGDSIVIEENDIILEEFDVVETGSDGYLEIEIVSDNSSNGARIIVQENTSYYFKLSENKGKKKTSFKLFTGSLAFKIKKLAGDDSVEVEAGNTTMGVRGTHFQVTTFSDSSNLTTCSEGKVSVASGSSEEFSFPGQVCQKISNRGIQTEMVAVGELDKYTQMWSETRIEILKGNIPASIDYYTQQYFDYAPEFDKVYKNLGNEEIILDKWKEYLLEGTMPSMGDAKRDEISLSADMTRLSSILPSLEHAYYTLQELDTYYEKGVNSRLSKKALKRYKNYRKEKELMGKKLTRGRYYLRIYREMKKAASNSIMDSDFGSDSFDIKDRMGNKPF